MEKHNEKKLKNMLSDRAKYHRKFQKGMSPFCSLAGEPIPIGGGMCESVSIPDTIDIKKYITQSIGKKNFIDREGNLIRIKGDHIDTLRDIIGDTTNAIEMSESDYDAHMNAINNHFLKRLGWIQVSKEFVPHIAIHRRPTPSQKVTLIRVMDDYSRRPYDLNLYLYDTGNPVWKKYNLTETTPEEVMKRIQRYFNTGILSEDVSFEGKAMFCPSCGHRTLFFDNSHHLWSCSDCRKNYKYLLKNNHIEFIPEEYDVKIEKNTKVPIKMRTYNGKFFPINEAVSVTEPNLVVYNGTNIENFDYSTIDLNNSREIGLHCGTENACRDRGYKFVNKLTLQSPKILALDFDMTNIWSSIEFVRRLAQYDLFDEKQLESLENQMRKCADSPNKYIEYSTLLREFFLNKGYNVISYPNEGEDAGSTSYIVLDMSTIKPVNKMEESMNKFPGRARLIGALKTFDKNGKVSTRGNWRVVNGSYALAFEVYYNDIPVAQCMTDNVLKITYDTLEFGFSKQELADVICSVYDDITYGGETEMNEGIWAYQTIIDRQPGEKQPSKTLLYGGNFVMSRSPYRKERFGADWKRHIKKIVEWSTENDPGLHRLTHDFRLTNFGKDCNSDEAYIAAIEDMISKGEYVLVEDTNDSDNTNLKPLNEDHMIQNYKGYELDWDRDGIDPEEGTVDFSVHIMKNGKPLKDKNGTLTFKGFRKAREYVDSITKPCTVIEKLEQLKTLYNRHNKDAAYIKGNNPYVLYFDDNKHYGYPPLYTIKIDNDFNFSLSYVGAVDAYLDFNEEDLEWIESQTGAQDADDVDMHELFNIVLAQPIGKETPFTIVGRGWSEVLSAMDETIRIDQCGVTAWEMKCIENEYDCSIPSSMTESKKKKKPYDSINYNAGNVEHNISMFNKMNSPIASPIANPVNGSVGEGCCEALETRKKEMREGMRLTNGMREDESLYFDDGDYSYHIFRRTPFRSNAETEWAVLVVDYGLRFHHDKMYKDEKTGIDTIPVDVVHDKPKQICYFEFTDDTLPEAIDAFLDGDGKKFSEVIKAEAAKHIEITEDLDTNATPKDVITEIGKQELRDYLTTLICEREDDLALEFGEDDRLWDEFFDVNLETYLDKYKDDIVKHFQLDIIED